jgi:hypothetical protein
LSVSETHRFTVATFMMIATSSLTRKVMGFGQRSTHRTGFLRFVFCGRQFWRSDFSPPCLSVSQFLFDLDRKSHCTRSAATVPLLKTSYYVLFFVRLGELENIIEFSAHLPRHQPSQ